MNRYTLIRYVDESTDWYILYALRRQKDGSLVTGRDNHPLKPFVFQKPYEAAEWVRDNCIKGSSVEWEGTTF